MPAGIETPLMGLTLWFAFNATVYYCLNSASTASSIADSLGGEDASRNIKKLESQLEAAAEIASESPEERELTNLVLVEKVKQIKGMHNG